MERLTEKIEDRYIARQERLSNGKIVGDKMCLNKLGMLEDLEEQGLLLRLHKPLKEILIDYFDIGNDTYAYNLTRDKEAFAVGTMTLDDFEEFDEPTIDDIVEYIKAAKVKEAALKN